MAPSPAVPFASSATRPEPGTVLVDVDERRTGQRLNGVGASLTGASAALLQSLDAPARERVLRDLFSPSEGIGLSVLRQPLGPSDFSLSRQTYLDDPTGQPGAGMSRFTARADEAVLSTLTDVRRFGRVSVIASPWTAPAWMKTSGSVVGGRLRPEFHGVYAEYLVRAIREYRDRGVAVDALTVQNEPSFSPPDYPGMPMSSAETEAFVVGALAPALRQGAPGVRLLVHDDNWDGVEAARGLLTDPEVRPLVSGAAFHCYAGEVTAMGRLARAVPDAEIALTECSGGAYSGSFADSLLWDARVLLVGGLTNGASTVVKWNLALDPSGGPHSGGCRDCRGVVTVDPSSGAVTRNEEYYALGHLSRFAVPGAVRIGAGSSAAEDVAVVGLRNPDGSRVALLVNSDADARAVRIRVGDRTAELTLPGRSVTTATF